MCGMGGSDLRKWLRHEALDLRFFVRAYRAPRVKSVASAGSGLGEAWAPQPADEG